MTSSGPHIQGTRLIEEYPTLFGDNYETADAYNEPTPFLDAIYDPYREAAYQGQQLPPSSYGNWLSNYGSGFGGCWGYDFFSSSNTEDTHHVEEQYDTDFSYDEDIDNEPAAFDYSPCYESCSRYMEELFNNCCGQEARPAHSYGPDEMGLCEEMFGYWPCLHREAQRQSAYIEQ